MMMKCVGQTQTKNFTILNTILSTPKEMKVKEIDAYL